MLQEIIRLTLAFVVKIQKKRVYKKASLGMLLACYLILAKIQARVLIELFL